MPNRMGNFLNAVLIGSLASVTLAHAADNCLSGPKGAAPKGSHWYYRIDHATKRNCWYVRAEGEKPAASASSSVSSASPQAETPLQPSVANARAEASPADVGQSNAAAAMPAPAVNANADNQQSTVASRWLDQTSPDSKNAAAPAAADSGVNINSSTPPVAEVPLAAAELPSGSRIGSVQTLLLAIIGATALAGLMAAAVFRFGSARRTERPDTSASRRVPWDSINVDVRTPSPPLAASAATPQADTARGRREAIIPNEITELLARLSREATT